MKIVEVEFVPFQGTVSYFIKKIYRIVDNSQLRDWVKFQPEIVKYAVITE